MKLSSQRSTHCSVLSLVFAFALPIAGPVSCEKELPGADSNANASTPPPGATNDGPAVALVEYADLEYASDGTFTLDGKKFSGVAQEFHKDGTTISKRYEYKDGLFEGTTREYYENGQISASTQWKAGQRHGANMYWNEQGKEMKRQRYEHDVAVETVVLDGAETPNP